MHQVAYFHHFPQGIILHLGDNLDTALWQSLDAGLQALPVLAVKCSKCLVT